MVAWPPPAWKWTRRSPWTPADATISRPWRAPGNGVCRYFCGQRPSSAACGVSPKAGSRVQADLAIRTARAFRSRLEGHDEPATWSALAVDWASLGDPYEAARARWREAEAVLDQAPRTLHSDRGQGAADRRRGSAYQLGAWPLLRAVAELARRAMLPLPKRIEASLEARPDPRGKVRPVRRPDRRPANAGCSSFGSGSTGGVRRTAGAGPSRPADRRGRISLPPTGQPAPHDFGLSKRELEGSGPDR